MSTTETTATFDETVAAMELALAEALVQEVPSLSIEQAQAVLESNWLANAQMGAIIGSRLVDLMMAEATE